ncbi:hypothetical protein Q5692_39900, partial [Microcoleus sp. C2C3]
MSNRKDRTERSDFSPRQEKQERTNNGGGINIAGETDLGEIGGIDVSGRARFGTEGLIPNQGITVERDVSNNTTKLGLGVGSSKGKLGGNVGVTIGYDEFGNQVVKEVELGINIAGFGGEIEIDDEGNVTTSISAGGAKIEVAIDSEGKKTVSVCYGIPGGEICVDFKPKDSESPTPSPSPTPTPTPTPTYPPSALDVPSPPTYPLGTKAFCKVVTEEHYYYYAKTGDPGYIFGEIIERKSTVSGAYDDEGILSGFVTYFSLWQHFNTGEPNPGRYNYINESRPEPTIIPVDPYPNKLNPNAARREGLEFRNLGNGGTEIKGNEQKIYDYLKKTYSSKKVALTKAQSFPWSFYDETSFSITKIVLNLCIDLPPPPPPPPSPYLPNKPNKIKKMKDCCD